MKSMNQEEEIIAQYISMIDQIDNYVVDIGASDGVGFSNSFKLISDHGWRGSLIEARPDQAQSLIQNHTKNHTRLSIVNSYVDPNNICELLRGLDVPRQFGFLSLDIDSFEYDLLDEILAQFRPTVICVEINERFPPNIDYRLVYKEGRRYPDLTLVSSASVSCMSKMLESHFYCPLHLEYNNLLAVARDAVGSIRDLIRSSNSTTQIYNEGYLSRADKANKFPWNERFSHWQYSTPQEISEEIASFTEGFDHSFYIGRSSH